MIWKLISDTDERGLRPVKVVKETSLKTDKKVPEDQSKEVFTELLADRSARIYVSAIDKNYKKKKATGRKK